MGGSSGGQSEGYGAMEWGAAGLGWQWVQSEGYVVYGDSVGAQGYGVTGLYGALGYGVIGSQG